jgi:predicted RNase H-like HicB family nuclease
VAQTRQHITVTAFWDKEASVWIAESADVPGLITEAATLEALSTKLEAMIPELLEANGSSRSDQSGWRRQCLRAGSISG